MEDCYKCYEVEDAEPIVAWSVRYIWALVIESLRDEECGWEFAALEQTQLAIPSVIVRAALSKLEEDAFEYHHFPSLGLGWESVRPKIRPRWAH